MPLERNLVCMWVAPPPPAPRFDGAIWYLGYITVLVSVGHGHRVCLCMLIACAFAASSGQ